MKRHQEVVIAVVTVTLMTSPAAFAQQCPPEVAQAKAKIASAKQATPGVKAPRSAAGARAQEQQAPRGQEQQAPRGQEQQAPRGQEQQAPRGQEQQAPRGQEQQAPRGQEQQAPRGQDIQAPRAAVGARGQETAGMQAKIDRAQKLVAEAEQQCKLGNMTVSAEKARAALDALK